MTQLTLVSLPTRGTNGRLRGSMSVRRVLAMVLCLVASSQVGLSEAVAQAPTAKPAVKSAAKPSSSRPTAGAVAPDPSTLKVMAIVNTEQISREDLAGDCLRHYGQEALERLINRQLIAQECKRRNVAVTASEVNQEIERMSSRFGLPTDQWLELLRKERGVTPNQYAAEIIWPTLSLRKLAGSRLEVTPEEVQREYDAVYGPQVKARLIVCDDRGLADKVRAQALAQPDMFGNLAKTYSKDASASLKGLIQPIRKNAGDSPMQKQIEQVAFTMKDGDISPVISLANQHVILKREEQLPPRNVPLNDQLRGSLEEIVRDRKMRTVAAEIFGRLQKEAQVEKVFGDPVKSQQKPGVAAVINGQPIPLSDLSNVCVNRYGATVLDGAINRRILEQACKKANVTITEADLDEEIARAAAASLPSKPDGSPDVEGWLKRISEEQGLSLEIYRRDSVWPTVALKKLVGEVAEVTEEDIQKGYQANYGPRARCRAIVLDNSRRAQMVWDMARKAITGPSITTLAQAEAAFGDLAEQYSVEATSRAMRGEVSPIQRFGGQPLLEKEAFGLQPGKLSSIIQIDASHYVILFGLGLTTPVEGIDLAQVRDQIAEDVHEKKLRMAMADRFDELKEQATVDNFLTGAMHSPKKKAAQAPARPAGPVQR